MKYIKELVFVILLAAYVFWPRYDLIVSKDPFWEHSEIVGEGFYLLSFCRDAFKQQQAVDYGCLKWSYLSKLTSESKYTSKVK